MKIMFVCLGNICRSPLAHAVFEDCLRRTDPELAAQIEVESSGTSGYHVGEQADERMRQTARARGVTLDHRARQFRRADFRTYDLVVAMDRSNAAELRRLAAGDEAAVAKIRLLREFEPDGRRTEDVPDPYYGGERGFQEVFEIAERCCRVLHERIRDGDFGPV
jgi:protein-tyrosine phosphatase